MLVGYLKQGEKERYVERKRIVRHPYGYRIPKVIPSYKWVVCYWIVGEDLKPISAEFFTKKEARDWAKLNAIELRGKVQ